MNTNEYNILCQEIVDKYPQFSVVVKKEDLQNLSIMDQLDFLVYSKNSETESLAKKIASEIRKAKLEACR